MIKSVPPNVFKNAVLNVLSSNKYDNLGRKRKIQEYITVYDDYSDFENYLSEDLLAGFSISKSGTLLSMFSCSDTVDGEDLVSSAVELGANNLDCFDEDDFLPSLYRKHGFIETQRFSWDDSMAPRFWRGDKPDVIIMEIPN